MIRILTISFLTFAALFALWVAVLHVAPQPVEARWIDGIYRVKEANTAKTTGPKVVIIGGSGTHYSYAARVISDETGLNVVNLGSHAGLGGAYILRRAELSLHAGDTAIVALEHQLAFDTPPSSVLASYVMTADTSYILHANLRHIPSLLFGYSPADMVRQFAANALPWGSPLYRPDSVDQWGDETSNTPENRMPHMVAAVANSGPIGAAIGNPENPPKFIVDFATWAKANNVRLIQAWPVTTNRDAYSTPYYRAYFARYSEIFSRLGFAVAGDQSRYLLQETDMLDSLYHANTQGALKASKALAIDLCKITQCPRQPAP